MDPKELEERFDRAGKRGVFGGQSKAKYWDLYAELFAGLAQRPADGFPHVFTETFAKAYEAEIACLDSARAAPSAQIAMNRTTPAVTRSAIRKSLSAGSLV